MSTSTGTTTRTFTVVDIRRVLDAFAADFSMIASATGLMSRGYIEKILADIKLFAGEGYLSEIHIMLFDSRGVELRAAQYVVSTDAVGWTTQQPGNNLWPRTSDGQLAVIVSYSAQWRSLNAADQEAFKQSSGLQLNWGPSDHDTSHRGLVASDERHYASNGWGLHRLTYR